MCDSCVTDPTTMKFKIGQWVFRTMNEAPVPKGTLGRITGYATNGSGYPYQVDWNFTDSYNDPCQGWIQAEEDLSLTPPE